MIKNKHNVSFTNLHEPVVYVPNTIFHPLIEVEGEWVIFIAYAYSCHLALKAADQVLTNIERDLVNRTRFVQMSEIVKSIEIQPCVTTKDKDGNENHPKWSVQITIKDRREGVRKV